MAEPYLAPPGAGKGGGEPSLYIIIIHQFQSAIQIPIPKPIMKPSVPPC